MFDPPSCGISYRSLVGFDNRRGVQARQTHRIFWLGDRGRWEEGSVEEAEEHFGTEWEGMVPAVSEVVPEQWDEPPTRRVHRWEWSSRRKSWLLGCSLGAEGLSGRSLRQTDSV